MKNKKVGTIEEGMLRRNLDSHGETGEISDFEIISDEDETNEKVLLYAKSDSSKRKRERRPSPLPRKKAKVTFVSTEFRKHIDICQLFF